MRKNIFQFLMLALPIALGLASCSENDNPVDDNNGTVVDPGSAEFQPEVLVQIAPLYVAPGVDADLNQAFTWATQNHESDPGGAGIYVVNKLTDLSENLLQEALNDEVSTDWLICVVNPVKAEIDAYAEAHDWFDIDTDNLTDATYIYGFNAANARYIINQPEADEGGDPIVASMNRAQDCYVMIAGMLSDYNSQIRAGSKDDGGDGKTSMEDFASHYHYSVTETINVKETFREVLWSSADVFNGSYSMTANYDVFMVHVYEGEPGAGDYYGVKMTSSIASSNMWKGTGDNTHGGVHVRWCGAYCTNFYTQTHLITKNSTDDDTWFEDTNDRIMFTAGGFPSPSTTVGSTTYEDKNSFSLSMSQSVGASKSKKGTDNKKDIHGEFSVSESWEWSHTESRTISDVDIVNETLRGNWAGWRLQFNNLPEYTAAVKFDTKSNQAARGTMELHGSWLWYDKTGKDNEDRTPYSLAMWMMGEYEHQSFISTGADLDKKTWSERKRFSVQLPKMVNVTAGPLKIKNDMPGGTTISNVKVITSDGVEASEFENTVPNGGEQELGGYDTKYQYIVTFKARTTDGKVSTYKYTLNPSIKLNHKSTTTVYAASDFTQQ